MDNHKSSKNLIINRTRQLLQEEIGVNVKTLNRTIYQLKQEGFFDVCKGKISFSREQYEAAVTWLNASKDK